MLLRTAFGPKKEKVMESEGICLKMFMINSNLYQEEVFFDYKIKFLRLMENSAPVK
jgi:hypothetical protein